MLLRYCTITGAYKGAESFAAAYWNLNGREWEEAGLDRQSVVECVEGQKSGSALS